jgi:hypothetical protein
MNLAKQRALELGEVEESLERFTPKAHLEPLDGNVQGLSHWHRSPVQYVAMCGQKWVASSTPAWALTILRDLMPEKQKPKQVCLYKVSNADVGEVEVRSGEIELLHGQTAKLVALVWSDQGFTDRETIS